MAVESQLPSSSPVVTRSSSTLRAVAVSTGSTTLLGLADLVKLLPTGTVFLFQFLNPLFTNVGSCSTIYKVLSAVVLFVCGFSCCFSCFTDSYTGTDGNVYYGIVTTDGLLSLGDSNSASMDFSSYKLRIGDFVHAAFSLLVFAVISLLDTDTVSCYYPGFEANQAILLKVLPPIIGFVSSVVFVLFPSTRNGIGYAVVSTTAAASSSSKSS